MSPVMVDKKKLQDVFKTVGLPPYTYVKPTYYNEVKADILQAGKHLLIEGPSGIGKTCVAFKAFEELGWAKDEDFSYLIPNPIDQNPWAHWRSPMDIMRQG